MDIEQWLADTTAATSRRHDRRHAPSRLTPHRSANHVLVEGRSRGCSPTRPSSASDARDTGREVPSPPSEFLVKKCLPNVNHDGQSSDEWSTSSFCSSIVDNPFARRPRHKTRPDLYQPGSGARKRKHKIVGGSRKKELERYGTTKKAKRSQLSGHRLMKSFRAVNVPGDRLTLQPSASLGIFRNGRASCARHGSGLPDLVFSQMNFLEEEDDEKEERGIHPQQVDERHRQRRAKAVDQEGQMAAYFTSGQPLQERDLNMRVNGVHRGPLVDESLQLSKLRPDPKDTASCHAIDAQLEHISTLNNSPEICSGQTGQQCLPSSDQHTMAPERPSPNKTTMASPEKTAESKSMRNSTEIIAKDQDNPVYDRFNKESTSNSGQENGRDIGGAEKGAAESPVVQNLSRDITVMPPENPTRLRSRLIRILQDCDTTALAAKKKSEDNQQTLDREALLSRHVRKQEHQPGILQAVVRLAAQSHRFDNDFIRMDDPSTGRHLEDADATNCNESEAGQGFNSSRAFPLHDIRQSALDEDGYEPYTTEAYEMDAVESDGIGYEDHRFARAAYGDENIPDRGTVRSGSYSQPASLGDEDMKETHGGGDGGELKHQTHWGFWNSAGWVLATTTTVLTGCIL